VGGRWGPPSANTDLALHRYPSASKVIERVASFAVLRERLAEVPACRWEPKNQGKIASDSGRREAPTKFVRDSNRTAYACEKGALEGPLMLTVRTSTTLFVAPGEVIPNLSTLYICELRKAGNAGWKSRSMANAPPVASPSSSRAAHQYPMGYLGSSQPL